MENTKVLAFVHKCTDGYPCAGLLGANLNNISVEVNACVPDKLPELLIEQLKREKWTGEKPYIFVMDTHIPKSRKDESAIKDLIKDLEKRGNVFFIDHHETGKWLMKQKGINAFVIDSPSASRVVLDTLKANKMTDEERKEHGFEKYLKLPEEIIKNISPISKMELYEDTIKEIDKMDSGQRLDNPNTVYLKKMFELMPDIMGNLIIENIKNNNNFEISEQQKQVLDKEMNDKGIQIKDDKKLRKDLLTVEKLRLSVDKSNKIYIRVVDRGLSGGYLKNTLIHALEDNELIDYVMIENPKKRKISGFKKSCKAFVRTTKDSVDASKIASMHGDGGGHKESASCYMEMDPTEYIKNSNDEFEFVLGYTFAEIREQLAIIKNAIGMANREVQTDSKDLMTSANEYLKQNNEKLIENKEELSDLLRIKLTKTALQLFDSRKTKEIQELDKNLIDKNNEISLSL